MKVLLYFYCIIIMSCFITVTCSDKLSISDSIIINRDALTLSREITILTGSSFKIFENYTDTIITKKETEKVHKVDIVGDTPLHNAVRNGEIGKIDRLLFAGARCDAEGLVGETPISLLLKHEKYDEMRPCFEKYGCIFVSRADLYDKGIKRTLKNGACEFNLSIVQSMHGDKVKIMMKTLRDIFEKADTNQIDNTINKKLIISNDKIDCLPQMTIQKMYNLFGEATIKSVREKIKAYFAVDSVVENCNNALYENVQKIMINSPALYHQSFQNYIMKRLAVCRSTECWEKLVSFGFNHNPIHPVTGPLLCTFAGAQNQEALYVFIAHGANYKETNARGKTCLDLLIAQLLQSQQKEKAKECLKEIQRACRDRIKNCQDSKSIESLNETVDMIDRTLTRK